MWSKKFWFADKFYNFMAIYNYFTFWQIGGYMNLYNLICTFLYKLFMPQRWAFMLFFFSENHMFLYDSHRSNSYKIGTS